MNNWKHWRLETDADNLAWLTFDRAETSTNTFSSEALRELADICSTLSALAKKPSGLAVLSAKENGFAAGADIDVGNPDVGALFAFWCRSRSRRSTNRRCSCAQKLRKNERRRVGWADAGKGIARRSGQGYSWICE